ncbi:MAG: phospholipase D-like domain-containing protein [Candidatus Eisenbacteria bacterium]|nr:phospholipase D-like domain-containing protein [Candidatus Eisenbacteria bacterium]
MANFDEAKQRLMYSGSSPAIKTFTDSKVKALIYNSSGGKAYFDQLKASLARTDLTAVYIAGWWLGPNFSLDGLRKTPTLTSVLKTKSAAGVDVRVLGWVMAPDVLNHPQVAAVGAGLFGMTMNSDTIDFINELRTEATLKHKAVLNILPHPAGAVHTKMVILTGKSWAEAYTGGLDLEETRHIQRVWHDVQAMVTGPAVEGPFELFRAMWSEVRSRPVSPKLRAFHPNGATAIADSHTASMPDLPARKLTSTGGKMHVQSVRTLPQMKIHSPSMFSIGPSIPGNKPLSFAPNGAQEIKAVWEKAIKGARKYIYIEDQAFSSAEVFQWINTAVKANNELKVILVAGADDPTAPNPDALAHAFHVAVNKDLLDGLTAAQAGRIGLFLDRSKEVFGTGRLIHPKSTIVDDQWALIGSANAMRRSLYTDIEHSVAFMDEEDKGVREYRTEMWNFHLKSSNPDIDAAIAKWFAIPMQGSGAANSLLFWRAPIFPAGSFFKEKSLTGDDVLQLDELMDVNSTVTWGTHLVKALMSMSGAAAVGGGGGDAGTGGGGGDDRSGGGGGGGGGGRSGP